MQITKRDLMKNSEMYASDEKFKKRVSNMYHRYYRIPDPTLLLDVKGVGTVTMNGFRKEHKRTFQFVLADGRSGDVFNNKGQFIARINGKNVETEEDFKLIKDLVVMGYFGTQARLLKEE